MTKWKLVPVEPTPEMVDAWNNDDSDEFRHAYAAMLEAAPPPPKLSDERILEIATRFQDGGDFGWDTNMCEREQLGFARAIEREILGE